MWNPSVLMMVREARLASLWRADDPSRRGAALLLVPAGWRHKLTRFLNRRQCAITFSSSLSFFPIAVDLPVLVESISSPLQANTVLAVFNAAAVFGQVFIGYLSDKFDPSWIVGGIGVGSCISAFLALGFANDLGKAFGFCILYVSSAIHRARWLSLIHSPRRASSQPSARPGAL